MPMPQKKDNRGAKSSIAIPAFKPAKTFMERVKNSIARLEKEKQV